MADHGPTRFHSRELDVWSLIIAALALGISLLLLFTGNGNQARFESDRQRCLDNLSSLSESLLVMKYNQIVTPSTFAAYISDWSVSERSCFGGRIISAGTGFHGVWEQERDLVNDEVAESWGFDQPITGDAIIAFETRIDRMLEIINNVYTVVLKAPGAGAMPWQYPRLLEPQILP